VTSLPYIVAKSLSTPSVLSLLLVISAHDSLRPMLNVSPASVENVIMCIGPTSEDKVLDSALDFPLNLINDAASCDELICNQVVLLLRQFRGRLSGVVDEESTTQVTSKGMKIAKSRSKKLMVLLKIADILIDSINSCDTADHTNKTTSTCWPFSKHSFQTLTTLQLYRISFAYLNYSALKSGAGCLVQQGKKLLQKNEGNVLLQWMEKSIDRISKSLENMFAMHPKRVEEMDYDRALPAISGLTNSDSDNAGVSIL
jgi:hypothetical protein